MATLNKVSDLLPKTDLSCDLCNSDNIQETIEGYVCVDCGIVLEVQKLEYHRPYNDDIIQYAPLRGTQMGTARERYSSPHSAHLEYLNKLDSINDKEKRVLNQAKKEISRIFSSLHLPKTYQQTVLQNFKKMRSRFRPGTKYRSVEKLVPVVVYCTFKLRNIVINETDLINTSGITKKEFNDCKLQLKNYLSDYKTRNRQDYIVQKILQLTEELELGMEFFYLSKKIMDKLWELIKNTTDNVIAGVVASISTLCSFKGKISINALCNAIGIRMSTIQFQVKERLFEPFKVEGFLSLVRSSDLLRLIMEKLGIIEPKVEIMDVPADIVEIKLGGALQVFNCHNKIDYYFLAFKEEQNTPVLITIKIYQFLVQNNPKKSGEVQIGKLYENKNSVYYKAKDPPMCVT